MMCLKGVFSAAVVIWDQILKFLFNGCCIFTTSKSAAEPVTEAIIVLLEEINLTSMSKNKGLFSILVCHCTLNVEVLSLSIHCFDQFILNIEVLSSVTVIGSPSYMKSFFNLSQTKVSGQAEVDVLNIDGCYCWQQSEREIKFPSTEHPVDCTCPRSYYQEDPCQCCQRPSSVPLSLETLSADSILFLLHTTFQLNKHKPNGSDRSVH